MIRSSIVDSRQAEGKLEEKLNHLNDQLTISKLQLTNRLASLGDKETVDVSHLTEMVAQDNLRDILMTSCSLVLISALIVGSLLMRVCTARARRERAILRAHKAKKMQSKVKEDSDDAEDPEA